MCIICSETTLMECYIGLYVVFWPYVYYSLHESLEEVGHDGVNEILTSRVLGTCAIPCV